MTVRQRNASKASKVPEERSADHDERGVGDAAGTPPPDEVAAFNWPSVQLSLGIFAYGNYLTGPASLFYVSRTLLSLVSGSSSSFPEAWTFRRGVWWWCVGESALLLLFLERLVRWQARADWTPVSIGVPTKQKRKELWSKMMQSLPDSPTGPAVQWLSDW